VKAIIASGLLLLGGAAQAQRAPEVAPLLDTARQQQTAAIPKAAIAALERAAVLAPRDAEVLRLLGAAQAQVGRTREALATLGKAAAIAPADDDIRLAIARTHYYRGENRRAAAIADEVLARQPSNGDARDIAESARRAMTSEAAQPRWRLDLSTSYSSFDDDARERWLEGGAALGYRIDDRSSVTGRVDVADRFGRTDTYVEARGDRRFAPGVSAYAAVGATPRADFLPEWTLSGGTGVRAWRGGLGDGVLTLDARHAEYRTGTVETLSPGIEQYLLQGRAWLTARLIHTWDENNDEQTGYLLRADGQVTDRSRLFVGYADAPETVENVTLSTRTVFAGGVFDLSDRVTLRLDYAHDDRERSYVRHAFAAGVGLRF
jgi:YaiO family outer membrane protein